MYELQDVGGSRSHVVLRDVTAEAWRAEHIIRPLSEAWSPEDSDS